MSMRVLAGVVLIALGGAEALSQSAQPAAQSSEEVEYRPPLRGAPARRVGGSSRGSETALPAVSVLAPDHVGLTVSEQPALYWYISKPTAVRVEVTLIDSDGTRPLVEAAVKTDAPGIHRLDLAQHGVRLKPEVEYQWSVSLVPNPDERSNDTISSGVVKRIAPPRELATQLGAAGKDAQAAAYAQQGIWYDALGALSDQIAARPGDRRLRAQRARILEQAGLSDAAAFERGAAAQ